MAAATTPINLTDSAYQAVWAAMHDDDELAAIYIKHAIVHALSDMAGDVSPLAWEGSRYHKWRRLLEEARKEAEGEHEDFINRLRSFTEPPF